MINQLKDGDIVNGTKDAFGNTEEPINFYCYPSRNVFKTLVDTKTRWRGEYRMEGLYVYTDLLVVGNIFERCKS
jgi:hypothetical protein